MKTNPKQSFVRLMVLGAALALIGYDAHISYLGFQQWRPSDSPFPRIFALMLFITLLGVSLVDGFSGQRNDKENPLPIPAWQLFAEGGLMTLYAVDIASNAATFGLSHYLAGFGQAPFVNFISTVLVLGMAVLLALGHKVMLRAHDKIAAAVTRPRS